MNNNIIHEKYIIFNKILYYQNKNDLNQLFLLIESFEPQNSMIFDITIILFTFISIEFSQYILISSSSSTIPSIISMNSIY